MKITHYGSVTDGRLNLSNRKRFDQDIKHWEGKTVALDLYDAAEAKSQEQGGYLWGVIYPLAAQGFVDLGHLGTTKEIVHEYFKDKFKPGYFELPDLETGELKTVWTTKKLSKEKMATYMQQIIIFCAEWLSVNIPAPTTET